MKEFIVNLADYSGPGAIFTLLAMWLYVSVKKDRVSFLEYMLYAPSLFLDYKELTKKESGRVGCLYYLFFILIILTFISILFSAFDTGDAI